MVIIIHIINSPYNFSIQNCPQSSDRVQLGFQSPKGCIMKHLKHTQLYSIEFLRTEITSEPLNYHREYAPYRSYSLFQFEGSDVISVTEYSFVFLKSLLPIKPNHLWMLIVFAADFEMRLSENSSFQNHSNRFQ